MSSTCRYISGDAKPRVFPASASYPFEKGDILFVHSDGTVRPATALVAPGTEAQSQLAIAQDFVGVAGVKNGLESGEISFKNNQNFESEVLVFTGGVWEFDCPAQNFTNGQGVGVYATAGAVPDSQKVDALASPAPISARIGLAVLTAGALQAAAKSQTMTRVCVEIKSAIEAGGIPSAGTYSGTSGQ